MMNIKPEQQKSQSQLDINPYWFYGKKIIEAAQACLLRRAEFEFLSNSV